MANNEEEDYKKVGDLLQQFVKANSKLQKGLDRINIEKIWKQQLGSGVAKHTTGIKLVRDTLYIHLDSSALRQELSYGKGKIVKMLNESMQKEVVKKLVLR